jgi:hypothetical protein
VAVPAIARTISEPMIDFLLSMFLLLLRVTRPALPFPD